MSNSTDNITDADRARRLAELAGTQLRNAIRIDTIPTSDTDDETGYCTSHEFMPHESHIVTVLVTQRGAVDRSRISRALRGIADRVDAGDLGSYALGPSGQSPNDLLREAIPIAEELARQAAKRGTF